MLFCRSLQTYRQFFEEPWENIKKQFSTLITGSINFNSMAMILWNMALQVTEEGFTRPSLPRTCLNCLAPFHVLENATTNAEMLDGMNASGKASKSRRALLNESMKFSKHAAHFMRREQKMLLSPAPNTDYNPDDIAPAGAPISTNPSTKLNEGAMNADQSIPPTRPTYYRTVSSDCQIVVAHWLTLSCSVRLFHARPPRTRYSTDGWQ